MHSLSYLRMDNDPHLIVLVWVEPLHFLMQFRQKQWSQLAAQ